DLNGLTMIALVYLGVMAVKFGLEYYQVYITSRMGQEVQQDIRMQIFSKLQGMELKFFDRNPVGRLVTRVTNDVNVLNELFSSGVVTIIGDLVMLAGYLALMFYYNWKLALAVFTVLPLLVVATVIFRKKVREVYRQIRLVVAQINAFVSERLSGIAIIKMFTQEERTFKEFDERNREALDYNLRQVFYYAVFFPVVNLVGAVSLAILIVYGGVQMTENALTFGELTAFILLVERFYHPIRDLSEKYNVLQASMASSERIFKLLDTQSTLPSEAVVVRPSAQRREFPSLQGRIEFEHVTFGYNPAEPVLHDVSFTVEPGQSVALVGATGAGKTSLISLLFRFYDFQEGVIRLDGRDIREFDTVELRSHLGLVLQDVQIFSGDLASNIRLGDKTISDERVRWAIREVGLDSALGAGPDSERELDLHLEIKERGATLSTGQKQLISFARALAHDPRVLALDEATSSIDTSTERLIQRALERIMNNRTSLVVAHRLSTIEEADVILAFHQGRLRESGAHSELLARGGIYYKLYQMQYATQGARAHAKTG
ncbi:MAG TPA: ABC transporter ATP-binding protein, partial [candidate division Zixibacteria bacterium]|nr:ABC transporter ATP-binding protein [candidate division Zixibacteria bacterium]